MKQTASPPIGLFVRGFLCFNLLCVSAPGGTAADAPHHSQAAAALASRERALQHFHRDLLLLSAEPSVSSSRDKVHVDGILSAADWCEQQRH
jgi:hypothetical protein